MAKKEKQVCEVCNGKGGVQDVRMVDESMLPCQICNGTGFVKDIEQIEDKEIKK